MTGRLTNDEDAKVKLTRTALQAACIIVMPLCCKRCFVLHSRVCAHHSTIQIYREYTGTQQATLLHAQQLYPRWICSRAEWTVPSVASAGPAERCSSASSRQPTVIPGWQRRRPPRLADRCDRDRGGGGSVPGRQRGPDSVCAGEHPTSCLFTSRVICGAQNTSWLCWLR